MSNNPLVRKLLNVACLSPDEQSQVDQVVANVRTVQRRQNIIAEGERPDYVHFIVDGWAARSKVLADGRRQILAFLLPGDFCNPHVPILREMDHSIVAVTDCKIAYATKEAIDELIERQPRIARGLWWATLVDEAVLRSWIVNLGRRDAKERLAHIFCELKARMTMVGLAPADCFSLPLTQEEIADATGMTSVHANRTLQLLRSEDLIDLHRHTLTVLNPERLIDVAGFNPNYLHLSPR